MTTRPTIVALVRGAIEAAVLAAIAAATTWLTDVDAGDLAPWVPAALLVLRTAEGVADERIDPTRQRGVLGGTAAPKR